MRGPNKEATGRSRELRRNSTNAESKLWQFLRNRQIEGHKFVRQEPIGPFFVDFVCRKSKLVVEIDGATHGEPEEIAYDARRTAFLETQGYRVVRFTNEEVYGDLGPILDEILKQLSR
jgi:very-short-patch-repair endonuclease